MTSSDISPFFRFGQLVLSGRFLRVAAALYGVSSLLLWLALIALFVSGANKPPSQSIGPDFAAFYTAGTMFRQGEKAQLYDFARQGEIQHQLQLTQNARELSAFVHPAHWAVLMSPFAVFSPRTAYAIYATLMSLCFVVGLILLRSALPILQARSGVWLGVLALFSPPVYFSISAGQSTGLIFLLHCLVFVALQKHRDFWAGIFCALGLLKPHLFLVLLPLFMFGKRPRALLGFALGAIATAVFDIAVFGGDVFSRNWASLQTPLYRNEEMVQAARMFSWQSFWKLGLGNNLAAAFLGWSCALAIVAVLCVLWKKSALRNVTETRNVADMNGKPADFALLYAITICGLMVSTPHLPVYDLGLLLLPMLVFADRVLDFATTRFVALRLTMLSLVVFTAMGEDFARQTHWQIVVPLLTLLGFFALKLNAEAAPKSAQTANVPSSISLSTP